MEALREMLLSRGATLVGFAALGEFPAEIRGDMPSGISITACPWTKRYVRS